MKSSYKMGPDAVLKDKQNRNIPRKQIHRYHVHAELTLPWSHLRYQYPDGCDECLSQDRV